VSPDDQKDTVLAPGNFIVGIDSLALSANDLSTIPGRDPGLSVAISPPFATESQLKWMSSDTDVAAINEDTGEINVRKEAVSDPVTTVIRVESVSDPSKYDTCLLTVYPNYPGEREWVFSASYGLSGDIPLSDGAMLLFGTGNSPGYNYGDEGPGLYAINPEMPYEFGIESPDGGVRTAGSHNAGACSGFLYPNASFRFEGHYRTSGTAARIMKIAALYAPFTVVVNYRTNSSGEERNADIRIGDKEGWRIEGAGSLGGGSTPGKTVWYSYEADSEAGKDEFIPAAYIEGKGGLQLYAVYVLEGVYEVVGNALQKKTVP